MRQSCDYAVWFKACSKKENLISNNYCCPKPKEILNIFRHFSVPLTTTLSCPAPLWGPGQLQRLVRCLRLLFRLRRYTRNRMPHTCRRSSRTPCTRHPQRCRCAACNCSNARPACDLARAACPGLADRDPAGKTRGPTQWTAAPARLPPCPSPRG